MSHVDFNNTMQSACTVLMTPQNTQSQVRNGLDHGDSMDGAWGMLHPMDEDSLKDLTPHVLRQTTTVGRSPSCGIVIYDERISGVHCEFTQEKRRNGEPCVCVTDRSSNGTFLNSKRIVKGKRFILKSADHISFVQVAQQGSAEGGGAAGSPGAAKRSRDSREVQPMNMRRFVRTFSFHEFLARKPSCATPGLSGVTPNRSLSRESGPMICDNISRGGELGSGANGTVYLGIDNDTGRMLAIKVVSKQLPGSSSPMRSETPSRDRQPQSCTPPNPGQETAAAVDEGQGSQGSVLFSELNLLKTLRHPRIVQFVGFKETEEEYNMFLEYVPGGSLHHLLKTFGAFPESLVRLYAYQVLQGLEYLHMNGVVHGDIKPANILVSDRDGAKLGDFGMSTKVSPMAPAAVMRRTSSVKWAPGAVLKGTPLWMSPELVRTAEPTAAADVWALGCVVLEMATAYPPWSELSLASVEATIFSIGTTQQGPSMERMRGVSPELFSFVAQCFTLDADSRPTASQLLTHSFMIGAKAGPPVFNMQLGSPVTMSLDGGSEAIVIPAPRAVAPMTERLGRAPSTIKDHQEFLQQVHSQNQSQCTPGRPPQAATGRFAGPRFILDETSNSAPEASNGGGGGSGGGGGDTGLTTVMRCSRIE